MKHSPEWGPARSWPPLLLAALGSLRSLGSLRPSGVSLSVPAFPVLPALPALPAVTAGAVAAASATGAVLLLRGRRRLRARARAAEAVTAVRELLWCRGQGDPAACYERIVAALAEADRLGVGQPCVPRQ